MGLLRTTPATASAPDTSPGPSGRRRTAGAVARAVTLLVVAAASIAFGLQVTPGQRVTALGQTVEVGATAPTWSLSGPGEVVLFGQSLPTRVEFVGPVRPKLGLARISLSQQVSDAFVVGSPTAASALGDALATGWRRYFAWQIAFVALGAVLLLGAVAGWRRYDLRRSLVTVLGGLLFVEAVNVGAIMITAADAPEVLGRVRSLSELVGRDEVSAIVPAGPELPEVEAVVLGDSVAAGLGGPSLPDATSADEACGRSSAAFAATLARVNGWTVRNLACSGATIRSGVLGRQFVAGRWLPSQLAVAKRAVEAEVVVVNVGANDMNWSTLVHMCAVFESCDDRAQTAYFQRSLDGFTREYYDLLRQLSTLPGDPIVLINRYYAPFGPAQDCLEDDGLTGDKVGVLLGRLEALNAVIAGGAETFGFLTAHPDFLGHELCTDQSFVQGLDDVAPLHPNVRGQLVIALAVERALLTGEGSGPADAEQAQGPAPAASPPADTRST
jgi:lysophospholipase L1-like esterase